MKNSNFGIQNRIILFFALFIIFFIETGYSQQSIPGAGDCRAFSLEGPGITNTQQIHSAIIAPDINRDGIPDTILAIPDLDIISVFLTNNDGSLQAERNFAAGDSPQGIAPGDYNRDGELDLAVTSQFDRKVNILSGDGGGNFVAAASYSIAGTVSKVATGDFNNDGWLDLAVGTGSTNGSGSNGLNILFGSRSGFTAGPTYSTTLGVTNVAAADFNADNFADIAVVFSGQDTDGGVRVYLSDGQGGFSSNLVVTDTTRFRGILTRDFNNDGKIDIVATGIASAIGNQTSKLIVLLGNGNGTFNVLPVAQGATGGGLATGDFNNDGKLDFVNSYGGLSLGNGDGTFTQTGGLYPIVFPNDIAAADYNGDGITDLAQANAWRSRLYIYFGKGNGKFPVPNSFSYNPNTPSQDSIAADFNGDGKMDVATIDGTPNVRLKLQNSEGQLVDNGTGLYSSGTSAITNSITIAAADFNQDGKPDLAFAVPVFNGLVVLLNNGNGQFTYTSNSVPQSGNVPEVVRTGNFNNDNFVDLVVLSRSSTGSYTVFLSNGNGTFSRVEEQRSLPFANQSAMTVTDINLDGKDDLVAARSSNILYIFKGIGNGTFAAFETLTLPRPVHSVKATNFNNDSRPDLAVTSTNFTTSSFVRVLNKPDGTFDIAAYDAASNGTGAVVEDFDRDGLKDVIIGGFGFPQNNAAFFAGDGLGNFSAPQVFENFGGTPFSAADFNNDGLPDYGAIGAVYYNNARAEPCLNISDATVAETDTGTVNAQFTVTLSSAAAQIVSVNYRLVGRNAAAGADFDNVTGTVTFQPGVLSQIIEIPVRGDLLDEADEVFNVHLTDAVNAAIKDSQGKATIADNDEAPGISISDATITEGSGGTSQLSFNASLTQASGRQTKVSFATQNGTAAAPADFTAISGILAIEPGLTAKQITVQINPDTLVEPDENFRMIITNPAFLNIIDGEATGTLLNDDIGGTVEFTTTSYEINEAAGLATITIQRSGGNASGIAVEYLTSDGTATANQDYQQISGSLNFGANEHSKTFTVPIINDSLDETPTETLNLTLRNISGGAVLGQSTATLSIADDDPPPAIAIENLSVSEGNQGTTAANFTVRLLTPSALTASVNYSTANGSATAPADYQSTSGVLTFAPGETIKTIAVAVLGDTIPEPDETFFLNFSNAVNATLPGSQAQATIINDDALSARPKFDYDGDGKADLSVFRPSAGSWYISHSSNNAFISVQFGAAGDLIAPADFDGDGKTDIAVFRPSDGGWYRLNSSNNTFTALQFGSSGDLPVPGDFDGDGKADLTVYRPSAGSWYRINSSNSQFIAAQFGIAEDKPLVGDFDGDGKSDLAVFRPSNGTWYRINSSNDTFSPNQFGTNGDLPVAADYDGDGKADLAVYRPSVGDWYIINSSNNSFTGLHFGIAEDKPAPADFDGDGKADVVVFRPSSGTW
ncbi:MAG TPA: FG-GAP-like repeat-containing protein, partial [Pyrinomonadaceae bacterium]